jgi:septal ring factor EnvC (AmiA/AmiB activator)
MDIGSGYEVVYGQLKDVCVAEGYRVSEGDVIGCVSEPTKYYSVEGPNLYFQLLKDGEPVNPLEYLDV